MREQKQLFGSSNDWLHQFEVTKYRIKFSLKLSELHNERVEKLEIEELKFLSHVINVY